MNNYRILDCTLRDGGYINNFDFGDYIIKDITRKLAESHVDIIECGFLKSNEFDPDKTLYGSVESIKGYINPKSPETMYVGMIAYGDIGIDEISECQGDSIDGIRVTFHKDKIDEAFLFGKQLMNKGYKVFMQPVGTTTYSSDELMELISKVNSIKPFAFYLVDTLGTMFNNDLFEMFSLADRYLDKEISVGFHSHNNLQMSFSNAIELIRIHTDREIIIDSSVFGMGRGAGNLCTELIMEYINKQVENKYEIVPVLEIFDEHISKILLKYKWGYSLPYFIASTNNCHPNYATHLINKQTLSIKQISHILSQIDNQKRELFDKKYIELLYIDYQKHYVDDSVTSEEYRDSLANKSIVILAPGKSIKSNAEMIRSFCTQNQSVVFAVNFVPEDFEVDYLFVSNRKRIKSLREISSLANVKRCLFTSNLIGDRQYENCDIINYSDYLNEDAIISDNAGLMLMNFLNKIGVKEINLAGFDGFGINRFDDYFDSDYLNDTEYEELINKTKKIAKRIKALSGSMKINFLTESKYE